jgi:hypothetical protein
LEKQIKNEFKIANLITSDNKQVYKPVKKLRNKKKNKINIRNEENSNRIKGVRIDGFDIYKPTKMLKNKAWEKEKKRQPITGVVLQIEEGDKSQVKKDVLFQEVFLEKKRREIQEMENELKEKMMRENLKKDDIGKKKTKAQINNEMIIRDLNNFTIKAQYRKRYV